jgi:hypothetical protein
MEEVVQRIRGAAPACSRVGGKSPRFFTLVTESSAVVDDATRVNAVADGKASGSCLSTTAVASSATVAPTATTTAASANAAAVATTAATSSIAEQKIPPSPAYDLGLEEEEEEEKKTGQGDSNDYVRSVPTTPESLPVATTIPTSPLSPIVISSEPPTVSLYSPKSNPYGDLDVATAVAIPNTPLATKPTPVDISATDGGEEEKEEEEDVDVAAAEDTSEPNRKRRRPEPDDNDADDEGEEELLSVVRPMPKRPKIDPTSWQRQQQQQHRRQQQNTRRLHDLRLKFRPKPKTGPASKSGSTSKSGFKSKSATVYKTMEKLATQFGQVVALVKNLETKFDGLTHKTSGSGANQRLPPEPKIINLEEEEEEEAWRRFDED